MAQDSHWAYDAYAFEYDMTTYLTVEYNGICQIMKLQPLLATSVEAFHE